MAVAVIMDFEGGTLEQYDRVIEQVTDENGGPAGDGGIYHWVAATDTGIRVTDLWETKEQFEAFAATRIGPATVEAGVPSPPVVTFYEVHNHFGAE